MLPRWRGPNIRLLSLPFFYVLGPVWPSGQLPVVGFPSLLAVKAIGCLTENTCLWGNSRGSRVRRYSHGGMKEQQERG